MAHISCFGGLILDWIAYTEHLTFPVSGVSYNFSPQMGGVAFNLAKNLEQLGYEISLFTAVNQGSKEIINELGQHNSIDFTFTFKEDYEFARVILVNGQNGRCMLENSETKIFDAITIEDVAPHISAFSHSNAWVLDTDLPTAVASWLTQKCPQKTYLFAVVVSVQKVHQLPADLSLFSGVFLNFHELAELTNQTIKSKNEAVKACRTLLDRGAQNVFVTLEENGAVALSQTEQYYLQAEPINTAIYKTVGAGDALASGVIYSIVEEQCSLKDCLYQGVLKAREHLLRLNS